MMRTFSSQAISNSLDELGAETVRVDSSTTAPENKFKYYLPQRISSLVVALNVRGQA